MRVHMCVGHTRKPAPVMPVNAYTWMAYAYIRRHVYMYSYMCACGMLSVRVFVDVNDVILYGVRERVGL